MMDIFYLTCWELWKIKSYLWFMMNLKIPWKSRDTGRLKCGGHIGFGGSSLSRFRNYYGRRVTTDGSLDLIPKHCRGMYTNPFFYSYVNMVIVLPLIFSNFNNFWAHWGENFQMFYFLLFGLRFLLSNCLIFLLVFFICPVHAPQFFPILIFFFLSSIFIK